MASADHVLFHHVVDRPDDELPLDVAALLIGEWEYDGLDVSHYLGVLDRFAAQVARAIDNREKSRHVEVRALNEVLFDQLGFRGDDSGDDPKHLFLNEVLDRWVGAPIALAVVYIEVGRRIGVPLWGVSFPGSYLVRRDDVDECLLIDPHARGMTLDEDDLRARLADAAGPEEPLTADLLAPSSKRDILSEMLADLGAIYARDGDVRRQIEVLERLRILHPDDDAIDAEIERLRRHRPGRN